MRLGQIVDPKALSIRVCLGRIWELATDSSVCKTPHDDLLPLAARDKRSTAIRTMILLLPVEAVEGVGDDRKGRSWFVRGESVECDRKKMRESRFAVLKALDSLAREANNETKWKMSILCQFWTYYRNFRHEEENHGAYSEEHSTILEFVDDLGQTNREERHISMAELHASRCTVLCSMHSVKLRDVSLERSWFRWNGWSFTRTENTQRRANARFQKRYSRTSHCILRSKFAQCTFCESSLVLATVCFFGTVEVKENQDGPHQQFHATKHAPRNGGSFLPAPPLGFCQGAIAGKRNVPPHQRSSQSLWWTCLWTARRQRSTWTQCQYKRVARLLWYATNEL